MEKVFKFKTTLQRPVGTGTWHYVDTPLNTEQEFGLKGKVPVCGILKTIEFSATLIPRGNGEHYLVLDKSIREKANIVLGDSFELKLWRDVSKRDVHTPKDFQDELTAHPSASEFFMALAPSYKKGYVQWILSAKKESTRKNRIEQAVNLLLQKKRQR